MYTFIQIIQFTAPVLVVLGLTYCMMNRFFERERELKEVGTKLLEGKVYIPLKIQAHERVILFLERINPNNSIVRLHRSGMTAKMLHSDFA